MIRPQSLRSPLAFDHLEDRITPGLFDGIRDRIENEANQRIAEENAKRAANNDTAAQQAVVAKQGVPTPTDRAASPVVFFLDDEDENIRDQKIAFDQTFTGGPDFTGGMWASRGDVTGDGVADPVVATGAGSIPIVIVYDGRTNAPFRQFAAYELEYKGGIFVTTGDVNQDGKSDIVVGTDQGGGPRVRIFSVEDGKVLADFLAIEDDNFRGGVRVSMGDITGDGTDDLLVSAGFGGGPRIAAFDGAQLGQGKSVKLFQDFFAFEETVRDGAYVALGYVDGDANADLIFGGGPNGAPRVRVASGAKVMTSGGEAALAEPILDFFAGSIDDRGGVRVGTVPGEDKLARILTVGSAGGASVFDKAGNLERTISRELALNSGLLDDEATRFESNPVASKLDAVLSSFEGSYAATFSTEIQVETASGSLVRQTGDVRYTIEVTEAKLGLGTSFNRLKASGGQLQFTGEVTVEVGGKSPLVLDVSGSFAVDAFPTADGPTSGFLSSLNPIGSDGNLSASASNLAWTPGGLVGATLTARNGSEFTVNGATTSITLAKGATPPAPQPLPDLNVNVIAALRGRYSATYNNAIVLFTFPLPVGPKLTPLPVTLTIDVTAATANDPGGDPRMGFKQYQVTGTFTASVPGKPAHTGTFAGTYTVDAFTGTTPTSGRLSFNYSSGTNLASADLTWSPAGLKGTNFTNSTADFSVRAASLPFTLVKS